MNSKILTKMMVHLMVQYENLHNLKTSSVARKVARLSALGVSKLTKPGMYSDGGGLYLRVGPTGAKSWQFRYMANGKRHDMGLGPLHAVSLMEARAKANECRKQRLDGINPLAVRNEQRARDFLEKAKAICFNECAEAPTICRS